MRKIVYKLMSCVVLSLSVIGTAHADTEFCNGFEFGYKMVKGNMAFVPFCPFEPFIPYNSTPFREGFKIGMMKAMGN